LDTTGRPRGPSLSRLGIFFGFYDFGYLAYWFSC
jgi:hypothetical protein